MNSRTNAMAVRCPLSSVLRNRCQLLIVLGAMLPAAALGRQPATGALPDTAAVAEQSSGIAIDLQPHLSVAGFILAAVFAGTMIWIIVWLLSVPRQVPAVAAHARRIVSAIRRIVVPVNMHTNWQRAVELACRLGEDQKAEILLTSVVEVPMTLSLNAPMRNAEKEARDVLDRALAIVEHHELPVRTQIERARQAGEGIAKLARDEDADLIVVATPKARARMPGFGARVIETLLHRAPCEVIIDSVPEHLKDEPVLGTGPVEGPSA